MRHETEPGVFREDPFGDLPRGHFKAIYADPPWAWASWSHKGLGRSGDAHYPTMTQAEMEALPVADLAHEDSVLFMWIVQTQIPESLRLIEAWGFKLKSIAFAWMKADVRQADLFREDADHQMGMGMWTRASFEQCLLATRGKPKRLSGGVRQGIIEPRREHSRKPDCVPARIERLVEGPYLELFARTQRPGWGPCGAIRRTSSRQSRPPHEPARLHVAHELRLTMFSIGCRTHQALANRIGVARSTVGQWLSGHHGVPRHIAMLLRLLKAEGRA